MLNVCVCMRTRHGECKTTRERSRYTETNGGREKAHADKKEEIERTTTTSRKDGK